MGLNSFKLASSCPSFDPLIRKKVDLLSVDIESLNFMTNGKMKKSSRERFF